MGAAFGLQDPLMNFYWILKASIPIYFIHGTRWCVIKIPNLTNLAKIRFFGIPCIFILVKQLLFKNYFFIFENSQTNNQVERDQRGRICASFLQS